MSPYGLIVFSVLLHVALLVDITLTKQHTGLDNKRFILEFVQYDWGPWSPYRGCTDPNCELNVKERDRTCFLASTRTAVDPGKCDGISADLSRCTRSDCLARPTTSTCVDVSTQCQSTVVCNTPWGNTNCRKTCGQCTTAYPTPPIGINGGWSSWGLVTPCSVTCGDGTMGRFRVCNQPAPSHGGQPCVGNSKQTYPCYQPACVPVIDGQWSTWNAYSPCTASCGTGLETRTRHCDNPAPSGGGRPCTGDDTQTYPCVQKPCSTNGQWGMWSPWTSCSASCGLGTLTRSRHCDDPAPTGNGTDCVGEDSDLHECSLGQCAQWTQWFEGTCSVSCGSGTAERLRHCSTGRDIDCPGKAYDSVPCTNPTCI